ncbi:hypothetical protein Bca4012_077244 [Brassica carinata]
MSMTESIWNNLMSRFKQDDAPRYKNYIELPVCTCGKCECNAAMLWEKLQQCSCVTKFLVGLNEVYDQMRRHILMLKPIPCIEEVYNMVAQDERQRQIRPVIKTDNFLQVMGGGGVISQSSSANMLELPQFTSGQLQALLQQLQAHFQPSETIASCSKASISDKGVMASQSSSGNSVSLSTNLRFENHTHF